MKKMTVVIAVCVFLSVGLLSGVLYARDGWHGGFHGGGGHFSHGAGPRVYIGGYFGFPYYYPYGHYRYPYPDPLPYNPDLYTDTTPRDIEPPQQYYWYYCNDSQTYYPYVTSCPSGWVKVVPIPPQPEKN